MIVSDPNPGIKPEPLLQDLTFGLTTLIRKPQLSFEIVILELNPKPFFARPNPDLQPLMWNPSWKAEFRQGTIIWTPYSDLKTVIKTLTSIKNPKVFLNTKVCLESWIWNSDPSRDLKPCPDLTHNKP